MKTGDYVFHYGLYSSECCASEIELEKLEIFPKCPGCHKRTIWDCVEAGVEALAEAA